MPWPRPTRWRPRDYPAAQREADDALMHRAWAAGLTALRGARPPARAQALRVITQASVVSDGVSEAGLPAESVAALFEAFADVEFVHLADLRRLQLSDLPQDGRLNVLVSNHRGRFGGAARETRPDLHLALWNPFQVLDVPAPALITWGYAEGAMVALKAWLEGKGAATATPPVTLN